MELSKKELLHKLEIEENRWRKSNYKGKEKMVYKAGYKLIGTSRVGRNAFYEIEPRTDEQVKTLEFLKQNGISSTQATDKFVEVYQILEQNPNISFKEVIEKTGVSISTFYIHRNILIEAGLIELDEEPTKQNTQSTGTKSNFNLSKGEYAISEFLKYKEINFLYQVKFSDCKNKRALPFDFGILNSDDEVVALIEYDGEGHFMPIETWGGEETLKEVQLRDRVKDEYCKKNGIPLLRIKYNEENMLKVIEEFIAQEQRKVAN